MPVGERGFVTASTLASERTTLPAPASAWKREAGLAAIVSTSVFHALQCGHCPCHLLVWPPHSVQAYAVLALAMVTPDAGSERVAQAAGHCVSSSG